MAPCTHEEADTRVFLHVAAATSAGHRRVIVRTSDSDVVVLGVSSFVALGQRIDELWIAFGMKRHFRLVQLCFKPVAFSVCQWVIGEEDNSHHYIPFQVHSSARHRTQTWTI